MLERVRPRSLRYVRKSIWRVVSYCVLLWILSGVALAGEHSARSITIEGKVVDILGRPIKGVRVTLRDSSGVAIGEAVTNDAGAYNFKVTTTGGYAVVAEKDGFRRSVLTVLRSKAGSSTP